MGWRRRRRQPMSLLTFLCTSCGVLFVFGNLLMLNEGFMQLYENTFKSVADHGVQGGGVGDVHTAPYPVLEWGVDLPLDALALETRVRHLMQEDKRDAGPGGGGNGSDGVDLGTGGSPSSSAGSQVVRLPPVELRRMLRSTSDCDHINNLTDSHFLASGWTKAVYQVTYRGQAVALKTVDRTGHEVTSCLQDYGLTRSECYDKAAQKILKETVLLQTLHHPHIVKTVGHCVSEVGLSGQQADLVARSRSALQQVNLRRQRGQRYVIRPGMVSLLTELGEPLDIIRLLQMSWEDRLRVSFGLTKLLEYLATSPLGSVVLNDFRRQQFVLVNGEVKLSDIDDMGFGEPVCTRDEQCRQHYSSTNFTIRTPCTNHQCLGMNEKKNIFNAARHFTTFLLPHGAPSSLKPAIDKLVTDYGNASRSASQLRTNLHEIVEEYSSGRYLGRTRDKPNTAYTAYEGYDMPGQFDYRCPYSIGTACTVSVYDQREAEDLCDNDTECQGFVLTSQRTWTGRIIAHLKNNFTFPSENVNTSLYAKPKYHTL